MGMWRLLTEHFVSCCVRGWGVYSAGKLSSVVHSHASVQRGARLGRGPPCSQPHPQVGHSWVRDYARVGLPPLPLPCPQRALLGLWEVGKGAESPGIFKLFLLFLLAKRPVSPYSGYNGQLLTSVYQPTEMALMHKVPVSGFPRSP